MVGVIEIITPFLTAALDLRVNVFFKVIHKLHHCMIAPITIYIRCHFVLKKV
jgi:hypothetical protein